jgi:hypothetical protein
LRAKKNNGLTVWTYEFPAGDRESPFCMSPLFRRTRLDSNLRQGIRNHRRIACVRHVWYIPRPAGAASPCFVSALTAGLADGISRQTATSTTRRYAHADVEWLSDREAYCYTTPTFFASDNRLETPGLPSLLRRESKKLFSAGLIARRCDHILALHSLRCSTPP